MLVSILFANVTGIVQASARNKEVSGPELMDVKSLNPLLLQTTNCQTNGDLIIASGESCSLVAGSYTLDSIVVSGILILKGNPTTGTGVTIKADSMTVNTGGIVKADGQGFSAAQGLGAGGSQIYGAGPAGAGHGGRGGRGSSTPVGGDIYGDQYNPITLGSGGGNGPNGSSGGNGGGAIHLIVNNAVTLNGVISANGYNGTVHYGEGGGGAGGSILINASSVVGNGQILVDGGNGYQYTGTAGGGAGGRIAIYTNTLAETIQLSADGGSGYQTGGIGTIYLGGIDPSKSTVTISPAAPIADGTSATTVTVTLKTKEDIPVSNKLVAIAVISGPGLFIGDEPDAVGLNQYVNIGKTDQNGVATATLKTTVAGERTINVRSGQESLLQLGTVRFIPGAVSASDSTITASPLNAPADGQTPITVTVMALDEHNNPIPDADVILQSTGNADITQPVSPTNSQGRASGQIVNATSETVTVSATVDGVLLEDTVDLIFSGGGLSLSMTAPKNAVANSDIQYTVTLSQSSVSAENVTLEAQLPPGVTYVNQNSPVAPTRDGQQLSWALGTFTPGKRLDFTIFAKVDPSVSPGTSLQIQAEAGTTSPDDNPGNNSVTVGTQVVDGRSFTASVEPASRTINPDAPASYSILINNTGLVGDTFNITLKDSQGSELNPAWYALSENRVALAPGETKSVDLVLNFSSLTDKCSLPGNIPFSVNVESSNATKTISASVNLQLGPVITEIYPENGVLIGSNDVTFSWNTDSQTTGKLYVYLVGEQPGSGETTPASTSHSVVVENLERNKEYEWYIEATSACGTTSTSTPQSRRFRVGNGVVFNSHDQLYKINRDYEQVINEQDEMAVKVTNQDSEARNVHLEIKEPYEDLIVNFRGSGSVDGDITLLKGETRTIELVFHAQDAEIKDENYVINAVLTSTNADGTDKVTDQAVIRARVLFPGDYDLKQISVDPVSSVVTYRLTNNGLPITDLTITAEDRETNLPALAMITPQIYHARVGTDESLEFKVIPLYSASQVTSPIAGMGTGGSFKALAIPSQDGIVDSDFDIVVKVADLEQRTRFQKSCSGNIYAVTFTGPISVSLPYNTWYCPNKAHIKIGLSTPPFMDASNLLGGMLQMGFSPASVTAPHTVSISMNGGTTLGIIQGIPKGTYSFNLSPSKFNTGSMTSAQQIIAVDADFPYFAHYQIGTGGNLTVIMDTATVLVCANSPEEARQSAIDIYGISPVADTLDLQIELPGDGATAEFDENGLIDIRAIVGDNLSTYRNIYSVSAEVEYLDLPIPPPIERFSLFDDGETIGHGDGFPNDRHFNALWHPTYGGEVQLTITATTPYGLLTDSKTRNFFVNAKPDFEVEKVFTQRIAPTGQAAVVTAQIRNNGFTVNGPITVKFLYYRTENNQKIDDPIHTKEYKIFEPVNGINIPFVRGESISVTDNTFVALGVDFLYYVEVVVDPGPSIVPIP